MPHKTGPALNFQTQRLESGLYLVATPIGNARDITLRALDTLASSEMIAAEDTRSARRLLDIHGIPSQGRRIIAYHDHNGPQARPVILDAIGAGASVAYVSDAGMPLIADPGFQLARAVIEAGFSVSTLPGPSAVLTALSVSGLATDRFLFVGFPPSSGGARRTFLRSLPHGSGTIVLFESPRRVRGLLADLCAVFGDDHAGCLCRELTKRFEDVRRGELKDLIAQVESDPPRGECVVLLEERRAQVADPAEIRQALSAALGEMSVKDAAAHVADAFGLKKRELYQMALTMKAGGDVG
ncbi:MAG: 16S rRNA (cytidine(1402)-2'-O)-methyltransferase [Pseudomonadota bacterium]